MRKEDTVHDLSTIDVMLSISFNRKYCKQFLDILMGTSTGLQSPSVTALEPDNGEKP